MTILDKIVEAEKALVSQNRSEITSFINKSLLMDREGFSLREALLTSSNYGIIAEYKRQSPSKGIINAHSKVEETTEGYQENGATALSILTNEEFFGGKRADVLAARPGVNIPILRKEFIVHEIQIEEAKAMGADAILLIAACLSKREVHTFAKKAKDLGLEVLMEVHTREELAKTSPYLDVIGVNNRNLKTFTVDIQNSLDLFPYISNDFVKISESGISNARAIVQLWKAGFKGFLVGEQFMKKKNPPLEVRDLVEEIRGELGS